MATTYPTTKQTIPNPTSTDLLDNADNTLDHDYQHGTANDTIEALQDKVGIDGSAVTTSHDYKLSAVTGSAKALTSGTSTQSVTGLTLVNPVVTLGSDATGDMYYRNSGGALTRLPIGTSGQILQVSSSGIPEYIANPSAADASTTVKGVVEEATQAEVNAGTATGGTGARLYVNPSTVSTKFSKFGGSGADGALTISSGTTTIDLANAAVVVKEYTSISITGTGKLAFTNPNTNGTLIILKSMGDVTLTSSQAPMIDASGLGAAGGASTVGTTTTAGSAGSNGIATIFSATAGGAASSGGSGGSAGAAATLSFVSAASYSASRQKYLMIPMASGGGSGMIYQPGPPAATATSGAGGRGGGSLVIECAGAWNFTTASGISVAGTNGGTGVAGNSNTAYPNAGGGGGGGGGYFVALYNTLTANSGTVTVSGGTGGNNDSYASLGTRAGGGGGSLISVGNAGTASGTTSAKTGGDGATGVSVIAKNTDF